MIKEKDKKSNNQITLSRVRDVYYYGKESGLYLGFICGYLTGILSGYGIFYFRKNITPYFLKKLV
tara:strand:+ start:274 stop:468 length:195 start_codon:yes stop_codon:yes gene_type:complete